MLESLPFSLYSKLSLNNLSYLVKCTFYVNNCYSLGNVMKGVSEFITDILFSPCGWLILSCVIPRHGGLGMCGLWGAGCLRDVEVDQPLPETAQVLVFHHEKDGVWTWKYLGSLTTLWPGQWLPATRSYCLSLNCSDRKWYTVLKWDKPHAKVLSSHMGCPVGHGRRRTCLHCPAAQLWSGRVPRGTPKPLHLWWGLTELWSKTSWWPPKGSTVLFYNT